MLLEIVRDFIVRMRDLGEEPVVVQSPRANKQYSSEERDWVEEADWLGARHSLRLPSSLGDALGRAQKRAERTPSALIIAGVRRTYWRGPWVFP